MRQAEQRSIALGAVRSQLRRLHIDLATVSAEEALAVLDDLHRAEPDLLACIWYEQASDHQIRLFRREWKRQFSPQVSPMSTSQVHRPLPLWDVAAGTAERAV